MQDFVTFFLLGMVPRRQSRGMVKGCMSSTWSPGCCLDKSRFLYLLPGWAHKCKYLQLQMCPFIIERERVVEHFCQRLEIIKEAISDASKNQAVIRGRKVGGGRKAKPLHLFLWETIKTLNEDFWEGLCHSFCFTCHAQNKLWIWNRRNSFIPAFCYLTQSLRLMNPQGPVLLMHQCKPSRLVSEGWLCCKAWCEGWERGSLQDRAYMCKFRL